MATSDRIFIFFGFFTLLCVSFVDTGGEKSLSRRKRYVVFPEGSSFSIALCMTVHTITSDNIFTEGMNWGVSYDLPNETKPELRNFLQLRSDKFAYDKKYNNKATMQRDRFKYSGWNNDRNYYMTAPKRYYKSERYYVQRRHRRDLYNKLEVIMNAMGFDGRTCILRALCEASQRLMPQGNTLIEEMMRIAFSLPLKKVFSFEPPEHHTYDAAHRAGHRGHDCSAMFRACSFSLIDMALGNYNVPDPNYDQVPSRTEGFTGTPDFSTTTPSRKYLMK